MLNFDFKEKSLEDITFVGLIFTLVFVLGFGYFLEGKGITTVKVVMVIVAGQMLLLLKIEHA